MLPLSSDAPLVEDDLLAFAAARRASSPKLDKYLHRSAPRSQPSKKQLKKQQQLKKRIRNLLKIGDPGSDSSAWVKFLDDGGSSGNGAAKRLQRQLVRQQNAANRRQQRRNRRKLKQILGDD